MRILSTVMFLGLAARVVSAQDAVITGRVTDWVTNAAIPDATLEASDGHGHDYSTLTKSDGTYELRKLPRSGELTISCSQIGYTPNPKVAPLKITARKMEWDAKLFPQHADDAYWKKAARKIADNNTKPLSIGGLLGHLSSIPSTIIFDDPAWFLDNTSAEALVVVSKELNTLALSDKRVAELARAYESRADMLNAKVVLAAGGQTIIKQRRGSTVVETLPDKTRIVAEGSGRGYVQRSYVASGQNYAHRTYYADGRTHSQLFQVYDYKGESLAEYVPSQYYPPGAYDWLTSAWKAPAEYHWDWSRSPWYGYYGSYFSPYSLYPSGSYWLTDYLLASTLMNAYSTTASAQAAAGDSSANNSAVLTPEVKSLISQEVERELTSEATQSQTLAEGPARDPATTGIARLLGDSGTTHVFVAGTSLSTHTESKECAISEGDVLELNAPAKPVGTTVSLRVLSSKANDCPGGSLISLSIQDVQEMQNHMRAVMDRGLAELIQAQSGKNGLPKPPETAQTPIVPVYAAVAPPADPNAGSEIARLARIADKAEGNASPPAQMAEQAPPAAAASAAPPASISLGLTIDQVKAQLGLPSTILNTGSKTIYIYKDMKVTFVNGKVTDVQ
jgi:Carboxypeptidase regulatory-like domain